ncbi:MAG: NAD(P)-binding domain-containing protein [Acidobacteriota bacterium]|nr:NAD(P)-binding domain-containing protein [Acidobacteriota bacterium]
MEPHEYIILGGGPAGLQLAYEFNKRNRDYLILEAGEGVGTFFKTYPRHRTLISINKVYTGYDDPEINLRWDWNSLLCDDAEFRFKNYSERYFPPADSYVDYLEDFAERFQIKVKTNTRIVHVTRRDGYFRLTSTTGERFQAKKLIVATGLSAMCKWPIPGLDTAEWYSDVSVDPKDFINQRVLIIGKGNSAFETADALVETTQFIHVISPESLKLAWESRFVGHLRAVNNNFLDTYQLKCQNAVLDGIITNIDKKEDGYHVSVSYTHAEGEKEILVYDRVIVAAGFRFENNIFDEHCYPAMAINNRFPEQTAEWESTTVPDLFFAGTLMQMRDYKKSTASFIHGFRYCVRALANILDAKYHNSGWPKKDLSTDSPRALLDEIIENVNRTSSLWQQFGSIGDVVVLDDENAAYYREVPIDLVKEKGFAQGKDHFVITLEFGKIEGNAFALERSIQPENAHRSSFLHPIIRFFQKGELVDEHHILEDLHAHWNKDVHVEPLAHFLEKNLSRQVGA